MLKHSPYPADPMPDGPRPRMLVVGVEWPPETFIASLLRGLADAGVELELAGDTAPRASWLPHPRVTWLRVPARTRSLLARAADAALGTVRAIVMAPGDAALIASGIGRQAPHLRGQLRLWQSMAHFAGGRWDLVYFPWNSAAIAYLPLFDLGIPTIVSCRGSQVNVAPYNPRRSGIRDGLRETFERAAIVHCVSDALTHEAERCGLDLAKVVVIRPAVDAELFSPPPAPRAARPGLRVVTTGSLGWRKGLEYALSAVRIARDAGHDVTLQIIGSGPERQRVLYSVDDLGLGEHVTLLGSLAPEAVRETLRAADAFVLTSLSEGISNAVLEAMACGLPVVTTDCGGMREAVDDGVEGFVVPVRDAAATGSALGALAADPARRFEMGRAARARVLLQFTRTQQIREFLALCDRARRDEGRHAA